VPFKRPCADNSSLGDASDYVPLLGKQRLDPIDYRAHAGGAAQIAVDDDPVFGGDFGDRRGQPLEQGMAVAEQGSMPRPLPARIASRCISIDEARSATGFPVSSSCRWTQRAGA
jgi:hypothetical protein